MSKLIAAIVSAVIVALPTTAHLATAAGHPVVAESRGFRQVDTDLANRCALFLQRSQSPTSPLEGDVLAVCRALRDSARDGGNAPDDCLYFTTVFVAVPLKQAMAACDALLAAETPTLLSATAPSPSTANGATGTPAWIEEVLGQLISAHLQTHGRPPNDDETARLRDCLVRNQDLGRNRALAPCAREVYGG